MGLINWMFDLYQHSRINDLHREAEAARSEAFALRSGGSARPPELERAVGELALAVKAIQRLAVKKGLCSAQEFERAMAEIDAEDGRADGMARWS